MKREKLVNWYVLRSWSLGIVIRIVDSDPSHAVIVRIGLVRWMAVIQFWRVR